MFWNKRTYGIRMCAMSNQKIEDGGGWGGGGWKGDLIGCNQGGREDITIAGNGFESKRGRLKGRPVKRKRGV